MYRKYALIILLFCAPFVKTFGQTNPADSIQQSTQDTVQVNLPEIQGGTPQKKGDITTKINYSAEDSIVFDVTKRTVDLFREADIKYGEIKLEAARVQIDWETNNLSAQGVQDSTGKTIGKPVFTEGPEQFVTDNIKYNFKTKKAIIRGIVTQQQEAYIHGEVVKKTEDNEYLIGKARYTTCNLEHPHFYIEARKLKMIPNDKIVAGPFHLKIADVSTPLGFVFGLFPVPRKRASGIIIPSYGEERRRGFFLRDGGYYLAINDYMDLAITGEAYTKGSRGFQVASNYRKRYAYNGLFNLRYNRQNVGEEGQENISKDFWVNWSHTPQSKGNSRFSASVNAGTSSFTQNNPSLRDIDRNINQQFNSSINYNRTFAGTPFSMGARANFVQDIRNKTVDLTLPELSFMMNRQYPFKGTGTGKTWYEQINLSYNFTAINRLTNKFSSTSTGFPIANPDPLADSTVAFNLDNLGMIYDRAKFGARHRIPISTSFNAFKYFAISPSFNIEEYWYPKKLKYTDVATEKGGVRVDTTNGFSRAATYDANVGISTKVYGTFYFNKNKENPTPKIQAIRHLVIPTLSVGYKPDFTREEFGFYRSVVTRVDAEGRPLESRDLSVFNGFAYPSPSGGEQGNISFSVTNNIEMKIRSKNDTAQAYKKVPLLERLTLGASYNAIADEFNLSNITLNGNTRLFNNLISVNFGGTINPYVYRLDSIKADSKGNEKVYQTLIDRYAWQEKQGVGKLERAQIAFSTNLNSKSLQGKNTTSQRTAGGKPGEAGIKDDEVPYLYEDPNEYVDFSVPWNLNLSYNFNYSKVGFQESSITQSARFSGDVSVTEKWKVGFNSGYDFERKEFTQTSLSIFRDLHCWQMNINWIPFGRFTSFSIDINVKASVLQDLKLSRRRTWFDN